MVVDRHVHVVVRSTSPADILEHANNKIQDSHPFRFLSRLSVQRRNYDEEEDDEEDEDEEEDDLPPSVDIANFKAPSSTSVIPSFGYNKGRSSPSVRTAMGKAGKSTAQVYLCTNCGGESVQWRGKCPTCQQWNTLQAFQVARKPPSSGGGGSGMIPSFSSGSGSRRSSSPSGWLDGIDGGSSSFSSNFEIPVPITKVDLNTPANARIEIPFDEELNAVLGGGLLKGSLILLGGDPGVGKSTLALQLANQVASHVSTAPVGIGMGTSTTTAGAGAPPVGPVWYVSGEETMPQIATRAQRLQESLSEQLYLLSETNLNVLGDQVVQLTHGFHQNNMNYGDNDDSASAAATSLQTTQNLPPSLLIIDSIQTVYCEAAAGGSPGGISQVRECMALLLRLAKSTHIPIVVIGHVTKTGDVAGPRMVEHMVDAVLYLEGSSMESSSSASSTTPYRWLRASKNRFGSTQVVGLYEFVQGQLRPSPELDMATALPQEDLEGCAMSIMVEGLQRAMTVEVQALVAMNQGGFGKKTVDGIAFQRLSLLLGVLQKHCGVYIGKSRDVYVQVVGGSSSSRSGKQQAAAALDLAVAVALTSSLVSIPVRGDTVFLAQVGLLGELRSLSNMEARLLQAERMGFSRVIVAGKKFRPGRRQYNMEYLECPTLQKALEFGLTAAIPRSPRRRSSSSSSGGISKGSSPTSNKQEAPESVQDLELNDIILDDEEDEYNDDEGEWY